MKSLYRHFFPALLLVGVLAAGCSENNSTSFQGYIEGEYMLVSSPLAGRLEQLSVRRGMQVNAGDVLFALDRSFEQAAVKEAEQLLRRAENRLADLLKGQRPTELDAIRARLEQAQASLDLSRTEYARRSILFEQKVVSRDQLDRTRTELERNRAAVDQLSAELETAQLGARTDQVDAAGADVEAARSKLAQLQWNLKEKVQAAQHSGFVFDTFYVNGEYVPAAHPVVSILPPGNIRVRFFVPETALSTLAKGQTVYVQVDGTDKTFAATITYISPEAEYTPPVIYSRETRSKLVFMMEADFAPAEAAALHPGQPADIFPEVPDA
ncbi:MAG: HlyD family efflux transporter periplasmic adaptor subunit [Desulfobulbaceae bacterium]|nr:HlyD family efflux transporter periplasmic adaptor subunit [Desulfobulbaceae bacterium]